MHENDSEIIGKANKQCCFYPGVTLRVTCDDNVVAYAISCTAASAKVSQ